MTYTFDFIMQEKKEYPIMDGHRKHYVGFPVQKEDGLWYQADVKLPSGFKIPFNRLGAETEEECQKWCDIHNNYNGWDQDEVESIIGASMGFSGIPSHIALV